MDFILTIDVEDWFQSTFDLKRDIHSIVLQNVENLLELLCSNNIKATFFVQGMVAEAYPQIVSRITENGHEIGSHGYSHINVSVQNPEEFEADILKTKKMLEDLSGCEVFGYRAPDFSITKKTLWALEIIEKCGYTYDSSIYPIVNKRYGIASSPRVPYYINEGGLIELPLSTYRIFGYNVPIAGGGYVRLLPGGLLRYFYNRLTADSLPIIFYCHPYEFNPNEFKQVGINVPFKIRLHQGMGRGKFKKRMLMASKGFDYIRAIDFLNKNKSLLQH